MDRENERKKNPEKKTKWTDKLEEYFMVYSLAAMTFITFINIVTRYFFGFTFSWAEQFSRICFVWCTLSGVSYCAMNAGHLKVDAIGLAVPKKAGKIISMIGMIVSIIYCAFVCILITNIFINDIQTEQKFQAIPVLPVWVMYLPGVLFTIGFCIRTLQKEIMPLVRELKDHSPVREEENLSEEGDEQ